VESNAEGEIGVARSPKRQVDGRTFALQAWRRDRIIQHDRNDGHDRGVAAGRPSSTVRAHAFCGQGDAGHGIAILDQSGDRLSPREDGEIATRSKTDLVGYWKLPEAAAKALSAADRLRTGDGGCMASPEKLNR